MKLIFTSCEPFPFPYPYPLPTGPGAEALEWHSARRNWNASLGECSRSSFILASENEIRIAIEDAVVSLTSPHSPTPPQCQSIFITVVRANKLIHSIQLYIYIYIWECAPFTSLMVAFCGHVKVKGELYKSLLLVAPVILNLGGDKKSATFLLTINAELERQG